MEMKTHAAVTKGGSSLSRYQDVMVGGRSFGLLLYYELCMWLAVIPGALGIALRKIFWPRLFGSCGKGVVFGANMIVRHPRRIHLGDRVAFGEGCILEARNPDSGRVIVVGSDCIFSTNVRISCKGGAVYVGDHCGIGAQTIIGSITSEPVAIGNDCIIGPGCYVTGGANYNMDRTDVPIRLQGMRSAGGTTLEEDVWLGAGVKVLGGVKMGKGSVAGAGAVVTRSVPPYAVCLGVPARVVRVRGGSPGEDSERERTPEIETEE